MVPSGHTVGEGRKEHLGQLRVWEDTGDGIPGLPSTWFLGVRWPLGPHTAKQPDMPRACSPSGLLSPPWPKPWANCATLHRLAWPGRAGLSELRVEGSPDPGPRDYLKGPSVTSLSRCTVQLQGSHHQGTPGPALEQRVG